MPTPWKTVRVFISSTFRDMHAERDYLIKVVFPALREELEKHRVHLVDIDLRWGVTKEQADNDQALGVCLDQIDACRPFFIGILGERYGYVSSRLPNHVASKYGWIRQHSVKSITELEIFYGVLNNPQMHTHAYFCFRDPKFLRDLPGELLRVFAEFPTDDEIRDLTPKAARDRAVDRRRKLRVLKRTIRSANLRTPMCENYPCQFAGLRINRRLARRELSESDRLALEQVTADGIVTPDQFGALDKRLRAIVSGIGTVSLSGLQEFGGRIHEWLWQAIKTELNLQEQQTPTAETNTLAAESDFHERFMESRLRVHVRRRGLRNQLAEYADGDQTIPCLVTAGSGSGKSAALAHFLRVYRRAHRCDTTVIAHFVGASPASTNPRQMLRRLCLMLKTEFRFVEDVSQDFNELATLFREFLFRIPAERRTVLVLDALNQLNAADNAHSLYWLPRELPAHVKIIASCIDDGDKSEPILQAMAHRPYHPVSVQALSDNEQRQIVRAVPSLSAKTLDDVQVELLLSNPATSNPLFLLVTLEELRGFGSFEELDRRIAEFPHTLGQEPRWHHWLTRAKQAARLVADEQKRQDQLERLEDIESALNAIVPVEDTLLAVFLQVIDRVESDFDPLVSHKVLALLASAKDGLSERELQELLARLLPNRDGKRRDEEIQAVLRQVRSYLMRKGSLLDFYHRSFREAVRTKYLKAKSDRIEAHRELASNFHGRWRDDANAHAHSELPFQQVQGQMWIELETTLCDLEFLQAKIAAGMALELLSDFEEAADAREIASLRLVRKVLVASFSNLWGRPELVTQTLFNRLVGLECSEPILAAALKTARARLDAQDWWLSAEAPIRVRSGSSTPLGSASAIQCVSRSRQTMVVTSHGGAVDVIDINSGTRLYKCTAGRHHVKGVLLLDDGGLIFLHADGSIRPDFGSKHLEGRAGERLFALLPQHGIAAVRKDNCLVVWRLQDGTTNAVATDLPAPLVALRVSPVTSFLLFVAGHRAQQLGIVGMSPEQPAQIRSWGGPRILDADIDPTGQFVVLSTLDRRMQILDTNTGAEKASVYYEQLTKGSIKGTVGFCRLATEADDRRVVFATPTGQVALWNWANGTIERLEDYASNAAQEELALLEWISPGRILLTTQFVMRTCNDHPSESSSPFHDTAVTSCSLTPGGRVVSIGEQDSSLRWFDCNGLRPLSRAYVRRPTAIATTDDADVVYVGTQAGTVSKFRLGSPENSAEAIAAGLDPVVSVLVESDGRIVITDAAGVMLRRLPKQSESVVLQCSGAGYVHQKTLAANDGLVVSWGVDGLIGSPKTVISLLQESRSNSTILSTSTMFNDVCVSPDGRRLCLAGETVEIRELVPDRGRPIFSRSIAARNAAFLTDDLLAVVLDKEDWVEVWRVTTDLPMLAAFELQEPVSCLTARGEWIVIGSKSGQLNCARLRGSALKTFQVVSGKDDAILPTNAR